MKTLLSILLFVTTTSYGQLQGNALHLDGSNDLVNCPLPAVFNNIGSNDITIEVWTNSQSTAFSRIVFAQSSASNFISLGTSITNTIYFYVISGNTTYSAETDNAIPSGQWSHVAARWTAATQSLDIFINGALETSSAGGGSSTGTTNTMAIGSKPGGAQFYQGEIDEIRIWNEARTDCEIAVNMNAELTGTEPSLVTYYNFNSGTAGGNNAGVTALTDLAGSANGTLSGFGLNGNTSNWIASGAQLSTSGLQGAVNTAVSVNAGTLTASAMGATYQWLDCNNGNAPIPGATMQSLTPLVTGLYAVLVTQNGCTDTSACMSNVTSITAYESETIHCYPNPVAEVLYIKSDRKEEVMVSISDAAGKVVYSSNFNSSGKIAIAFQSKPGVYIVRLDYENERRMFRIVKGAD